MTTRPIKNPSAKIRRAMKETRKIRFDNMPNIPENVQKKKRGTK